MEKQSNIGSEFKIIFLGTPEFAASCLEQLISDSYNIVCVVTGPDKKKGRGQKLQPTEVKITAEQNHIPVLQPDNLKDANFLSEIKKYNADLGVVVAFRMLPEAVWKMPRLGTINLHASLLPQYRGAAPINWAIINGESKTGITTFFLKHEIDTGDILMQREINIGDKMNAGELHDILKLEGSKLLSETIRNIINGNTQGIPQEKMESGNAQIKSAPKIFKSDCCINWDRNAKDVYNMVRGLSPYPGAWSTFLLNSGEEIIFKVFTATLTSIKSNGEVQKIKSDGKNELLVGCADYFLQIDSVQLEGRQKLNTKDFLRGFNINNAKIISHD